MKQQGLGSYKHRGFEISAIYGEHSRAPLGWLILRDGRDIARADTLHLARQRIDTLAAFARLSVPDVLPEDVR